VTLTLEKNVQWLALAVSHSGMMISPQPSKAVVGTAGSVQKRSLVVQNPSDIGESAPLDTDQNLQEASFVSENGATFLSYRLPKADFTRWVDRSTGTVHFLYAYGSDAFGFHGFRRGVFTAPLAAVDLMDDLSLQEALDTRGSFIAVLVVLCLVVCGNLMLLFRCLVSQGTPRRAKTSIVPVGLDRGSQPPPPSPDASERPPVNPKNASVINKVVRGSINRVTGSIYGEVPEDRQSLSMGDSQQASDMQDIELSEQSADGLRTANV